MQTAAMQNDGVGAVNDKYVRSDFTPLLTYTHRLVQNEVRCSGAWEQSQVIDRLRGVPSDSAMCTAFLGLQAAEAPLCFSISAFTGTAECISLFPRGSLLFLHTPAQVDPSKLSARCAALHSAGFILGISEYRGESVWESVFPLISYIRCEYNRHLLPRQREILSSPLRRRISFVASGVRTQADLADAMRDGFQLFQGDFAYQVSRLHWPEQEFTQRTLLLEKVCHSSESTSALLAEFLEWTSLSERLSALLRQADPGLRASVENPEHLFVELGADRTRRFMRIGLMRDLTGSSSPVLLRRLFRSARFHELMRETALRAVSPSACFEGMMLSALHASYDTASGDRSSVDYAFELLKHSLGTPMNCSAFDKNYLIAQACSEARWSDAEQLCKNDGIPLATVVRSLREAEAWAFHYVKLDSSY